MNMHMYYVVDLFNHYYLDHKVSIYILHNDLDVYYSLLQLQKKFGFFIVAIFHSIMCYYWSLLLKDSA